MSKEEIDKSVSECNDSLFKNGYCAQDIRKALNKKKCVKKMNADVKSVLKLPFVNDSLIRKVNGLIKKYNLSVNLVSVGNKKLRHCFKPKSFVKKHENCSICIQLPEQYNCENAGVIYQIKCQFCTLTYVGKTSRPFHFCYREHQNRIKKEKQR